MLFSSKRKISEDQVTKAIAGHLKSEGWAIVSLNSPFSGGSVRIAPTGGIRGRGTLLPDIIVIQKKRLLIVECASPYKKSDEVKLKKYYWPQYSEPIANLFPESSYGKFEVALGLPRYEIAKVEDKSLQVFLVSEFDLSVLQKGE